MMRVREVQLSDKDELSTLIKLIDGESDFMLFGAGEREMTAGQSEKMIINFRESENSTILITEENRKLTGYLMAVGGKAKKNKHSAYLVLGVGKNSRKKGAGTLLLEAVEKWAINQGLRRLELTTMIHNEAALKLYKKSGFEVEGLKRHSFFIKGRAVDEYYMGKLLNNGGMTNGESNII
ncbi:GNAT family N-acetyltransferase [Salipaludibacillus sp. CUR1]|uniref:GNAT family N-acetyltransferase n=1 Tax=Salipaludibacillus sp. CUR1 TaxID=2820003 RepID=UPI001E479262|nr:GNAT family N-acetyltransferase [Salipaludibacillus sp. CUR1]MCE7793253.1 GNAT family N-acetyltransferase [Salipaludibacillus sp. CUR1]